MAELQPDDIQHITGRLDEMFRRAGDLYPHLGGADADLLQADQSDGQEMAKAAMSALARASKSNNKAAAAFMRLRPKLKLVQSGGPGSNRIRDELGNELARMESWLGSAQNFLQTGYLPTVTALDNQFSVADPGDSSLLDARDMAQQVSYAYTSVLPEVHRLQAAFPAPAIELD